MISTAWILSAARFNRETILAISLPNVVGLAVWPCVRANIANEAFSCAILRSFSITACKAGSTTSSRAALIIMPWDVLLISSEVQAKWMNSATGPTSSVTVGSTSTCLGFRRASSGGNAKPTDSLIQYSTAFTSWLVMASISLILASFSFIDASSLSAPVTASLVMRSRSS